MANKIVLLHHLSVEIMGREFTPQGFFQHSILIILTSATLWFAAYGLIAFVRKSMTGNSKAVAGVSSSRESSITNL